MVRRADILVCPIPRGSPSYGTDKNVCPPDNTFMRT
jgi:hypothetical protein